VLPVLHRLLYWPPDLIVGALSRKCLLACKTPLRLIVDSRSLPLCTDPRRWLTSFVPLTASHNSGGDCGATVFKTSEIIVLALRMKHSRVFEVASVHGRFIIEPRGPILHSSTNHCNAAPLPSSALDKRTNELAMVVKDIRALRDSFEP